MQRVNFQLVPGPSDVLVITATNFGRNEIRVGNQSSVSVVLKPASNVMEEVVVTALGQTSKKAKVGYATTTFNSEAINRTANVNAFDGLAGKIPGAEISNTGGPGLIY